MRFFLLVTALVAGFLIDRADADIPSPVPVQLLAQHTSAFSIENERLTGDGATLLRQATSDAQFVLVGEAHYDHLTPIFANALFSLLKENHGFDYLAVEQDPVAIEDALARDKRGNEGRIGDLARRYPSLFEYASDEDIHLLAAVGQSERDGPAIWGLEQATGATRYLEELQTLAPDRATRLEVTALLNQARAADHDPKYSVHFFIDNGELLPRLRILIAAFHAPASSRAGRLLTALATSAEIFDYYRRGEADPLVALYNGTLREDWLKQQFVRKYNQAAKTRSLPHVMFKFGGNHMGRGLNSSGAYSLGNFASEFAIAHGMRAYGIQVVPIPSDGYAALPAWMLRLLPSTPPTKPVIVDLRALRAASAIFRAGLEPAARRAQLDLVFGFDALVVLPGSRPASMVLSGLSPP
jgi:hypothetical protein